MRSVETKNKKRETPSPPSTTSSATSRWVLVKNIVIRADEKRSAPDWLRLLTKEFKDTAEREVKWADDKVIEFRGRLGMFGYTSLDGWPSRLAEEIEAPVVFRRFYDCCLQCSNHGKGEKSFHMREYTDATTGEKMIQVSLFE